MIMCVKIYDYVLKDVKRCENIWLCVKRCEKMWKYM